MIFTTILFLLNPANAFMGPDIPKQCSGDQEDIVENALGECSEKMKEKFDIGIFGMMRLMKGKKLKKPDKKKRSDISNFMNNCKVNKAESLEDRKKITKECKVAVKNMKTPLDQ